MISRDKTNQIELFLTNNILNQEFKCLDQKYGQIGLIY